MALRLSADAQDRTRTVTLGAQTAWSWSGWVRLRADRNAASTFFSMDSSTSSYNILQTFSDGTELFFAQSGGALSGYGNRVLTVDAWYYVGISVNGAAGTMITRSATDTSFTASTWTDGAANTTITTYRLGEDVFGANWLNGNLAAVKWWSTTLTQTELENEFWTTTPRRTASLRSWYPFGSDVVDYSGNAQTLTGTGGSFEDGPPIAWRPGRPHVVTPLSIPAEVTPAPILGVASIPPPGVSTGLTVRPSPILGTATIPTPDVFVGSSPPTNVQPGPILGAASIPTPTITTVKNVNTTPHLLVGRAIIPTPNVSVPISAGADLDGPAQISLAGFKMGSGTPYPLTEIAGADIDLPSIDNGNVDNPSSHGATSGRKLSQPRVITANIFVSAPPDEMREVMEAFRANTPLAEADEELDLAIQVLDEIYVTRGAVIHRSAPIVQLYHLGYANAVLQVECSDPRLYSRALNSATIADGDTIEVFHAGNTSTRPLIRCPGPATGPLLEIARILDDGTDDVRVIEFDVDIASDETLIIDVVRGTAEIGAVSQMRWLTGASIGVPDFVLGRGFSEITYETSGGSAPPAVALWRHAHL